MTEDQFLLLAQLLQLSPSPELEQEVRHTQMPNSPAARVILALHHRIKEAYVIHRPTAFRVVVSHDDLDRFPGALHLKPDMQVQLVSYTSERYISVRVTQLPQSPKGYVRGVITEQLVANSVFQVGDSVYFSEDQVHALLGSLISGCL